MLISWCVFSITSFGISQPPALSEAGIPTSSAPHDQVGRPKTHASGNLISAARFCPLTRAEPPPATIRSGQPSCSSSPRRVWLWVCCLIRAPPTRLSAQRVLELELLAVVLQEDTQEEGGGAGFNGAERDPRGDEVLAGDRVKSCLPPPVDRVLDRSGKTIWATYQHVTC